MNVKFPNFKVFNTLDSTNCEAKRLAGQFHPETWIIARKQTNGRGRRGKSWLSISNNFTASRLLYPTVDETKFPLYSYIAAIAFYDAVIDLGIDPKRLFLKWPNDLMVNYKKVGGILIESKVIDKTKGKALVIGFGLNLETSPSPSQLNEDAFTPDCLKSHLPILPKSEDFLKILILFFEKWNNIYLSGGFECIREAFLRRTFEIGKNVQIKTVNKIISGDFSGLNDDGSLILKCSSEQIIVTAGDVILIGN